MTPAERIRGVKPYRPSRPARPDALRLHANEGRAPALDLAGALGGLDLARYPDASRLEARLAERHGVEPARVVVTAGADDALARVAMATLEPGRRAALFEPTFEMIPRYVALSGATPARVRWLDGPFPEAAFAEALCAPGPAVGFLVTPSSPAGEAAPTQAILRVADAARDADKLLVVDLAYVEFADEDPTEQLAARGDVVLTRTFSKALGLAGLRVGYAICPAEVADWLRAVGQPFAVSAPALALAERALDEAGDLEPVLRRVREERAALWSTLEGLGARPVRSQANFVLARVGERSLEVAARLEQAGFRVRALSGGALDGALRISCPQDAVALRGLISALEEALGGAEASS